MKDHEIRELTNNIRDTLITKMHHIKFPNSLREVIAGSIRESLGEKGTESKVVRESDRRKG